MIGAIRPSKWAKFLPEFGWTPYVLTVKNIYLDRADFPRDVPEERVFRTPFLDFWKCYSKTRAFFSKTRNSEPVAAPVPGKQTRKKRAFTISSTTRIPDRATGWILYGIARGLKEIRKQGIGVIVSTSGPPSNHIIAWALHKLTRLPWLADYRDPWTTNPFSHQAGGLQKIEASMEKRMLRSAILITTVSKGYAGNLAAFHQRPVEVIFNGFDEEERCLPDAQQLDDSRLKLAYTGTLSEVNRNPERLFKAIRDLMDEGVICESNFLVSLYGTEAPWLNDLVNRYQVKAVFHNGGIISRQISLEQQGLADALLVIDTSTEPGAGVNLPTKIFDYLNLERRVLALTRHQSDIEAFLAETRAGVVCETVEEIKTLLTGWLTEYQATGKLSFQGDPGIIKQYSRRNQAGKLAGLLDGLLTTPARESRNTP